MNIVTWLNASISTLEDSFVESARLDAEILLADTLKKDRSWIHAHNEYELKERTISKLDAYIKRRATHEPLAYIRGIQEFYGREFIVTKDTLTPRPETEAMVELLLERIKNQNNSLNNQLQIVDIGTGSGCIIITAALELATISNLKSQIFYLGLDISEKALKVARHNAKNLLSKKFRHVPKFFMFDLMSQLLAPHLVPSTILVANLPYVPNDYEINTAATHEPSIAIFGGGDGLDYYRELFRQLRRQSTADTQQQTEQDPNILAVFTESLEFQHSELESIAHTAGYTLEKTLGLIQLFTKPSPDS